MSKFGSHKSMVDRKATSNLGIEGKVVCRDEYGLYITNLHKLDDNLADYNRFNPTRMARFATPDKEWVRRG